MTYQLLSAAMKKLGVGLLGWMCIAAIFVYKIIFL